MMAMHDCGGTVLYSRANGEPQLYCDWCGAYTHDPYMVEVGQLPTGMDREANRRAIEDGEVSSPDCEL